MIYFILIFYCLPSRNARKINAFKGLKIKLLKDYLQILGLNSNMQY